MKYNRDNTAPANFQFVKKDTLLLIITHPAPIKNLAPDTTKIAKLRYSVSQHCSLCFTKSTSQPN